MSQNGTRALRVTRQATPTPSAEMQIFASLLFATAVTGVLAFAVLTGQPSMFARMAVGVLLLLSVASLLQHILKIPRMQPGAKAARGPFSWKRAALLFLLFIGALVLLWFVARALTPKT